LDFDFKGGKDRGRNKLSSATDFDSLDGLNFIFGRQNKGRRSLDDREIAGREADTAGQRR
jgi:hypothetical protein